MSITKGFVSTPEVFPLEYPFALTDILSSDVCSISFERQTIVMGPEQKVGRKLSGSATEQSQQ
jgi:hypothetical protein